jgi:hypothetical protein
MRLAIIGPENEVILAWPTVESAHADIADQFAAKLAPRRWQGRKRAKTAVAIRAHLLELQKETIRL